MNKLYSCPILVLAWKRPDKLNYLLDALRLIKPYNIYIFCDGPNNDCKNEVLKTREIIDLKVDWNCNLRKKYENKNLGCKKGVSNAINWFFNDVKEGIIIEDDCIPDSSFLFFAEEMLIRYRKNKKIFTITGDCFIDNNINKDGTYYYSKYPTCWGWATWKDRWKFFDDKISFWPEYKKTKDWHLIHNNFIERTYWNKIFDKVYYHEIDSWAYPWTACVWKNKGITVTPNINLVSNIGFDKDGTNTKQNNQNLAYKKRFKLEKFIAPVNKNTNVKLDKICFETVFFKLTYKRFFKLIFKIIKIIIYKFYNLFQ